MTTPFLTNHAAVAPHREAIRDLRKALRDVEDFARTLRRERETADPDGLDPLYEGLRQRERAAHDELTRMQASVDRLLLVFRDIESDMQRLAEPTPK